MTGIQANTGLATGIDIQGTVDKLIALEGKPRDDAKTQLAALKTKQTAVADVTASVISIQLAAKSLGKTSLFAQKTVTSSNSSVLTTTVLPDAVPTTGTYTINALRKAQAQQLLSQGFASTSATIGAGTFTLNKGTAIDTALDLSTLNGGAGIVRGKIRITDRSGTAEVIDLRNVQNIDDVLNAINSNENLNVKAVAEGDHIRLTDNTGATTNNLKVQEVGSGTTAASLGLNGIDVATATAAGTDVVKLYAGLSLSKLNDGNGLSFQSALPDLRVTLKDGSSLDVDFRKVAKPADHPVATVHANNGVSGDLVFTSTAIGDAYDGVAVKFVDSGSVTAGSETVAYDATAKTLTFNIASGSTTADDVIAALGRDSAASALFTAARGTGGDGTGTIVTADTATTSGGAATAAGSESTIADLLATINDADPTKLSAQLSADGDRIVLNDLTGGSGSLSAQSINGGSLAEDLGLAKSTTGGSLAGGRLLAGLNTTLLHSLKGGQGTGALGSLAITDRTGTLGSVDLSGAETVDDVLTAINSSGLSVRAQLNTAKNGIQIVDTSGASTSNLIIANGDSSNTANTLGIAVNAATTIKSGGSLNRQSFSEQTTLASFNYGKGVRLGSFTITDSTGASRGVNLATSSATSLGNVIDTINGLGIGVKARINDSGDGLALIDTAGGTGTLSVSDSTAGTAADLKLLGPAVDTTVNGSPAKVIDGSTALKITLDGTDTLATLVTKVNALNAGITATVFSDGSSSAPNHLSLIGANAGAANEWQVDASNTAFGFTELAAAQDALVSVGSSNSANPTLFLSSATNVIDNAVPGVRVTLSGTSSDPITVAVTQDSSTIASRVKLFVDSYNKLQDKLKQYDYYDANTDTRGPLYTSSDTLKIKTDLPRLLSGTFQVTGKFQSLQSVGVSLNDDGTATFDSTKLAAAYASDSSAVEQLFTDATSGFGTKVDTVVDRLAGVTNSVLINRTNTLQTQTDQLTQRIARMEAALATSKDRLLTKFYDLETTISKIQNSFSSISGTLSNAVNLYSTLK